MAVAPGGSTEILVSSPALVISGDSVNIRIVPTKDSQKTIAIAYITETGTTRRASEILAERLRSAGFDAHAIRLSELGSPLNYGSVIFGTPIVGLRALPQLQLYLEDYQPELSNVLGLFAVSFIYKRGRRMWSKSIENHFQRLSSQSMARSCRIFGKNVDKKTAGIVKLFFGVPPETEPDQFHVEDVESWGDELITLLRQSGN